jgi:serine/threonine-protein kinase
MLEGKCRIDGVLGVGGMGVVLSATHLHLEQKVAVKILLPDLARNAEVVARFLREGRAAVKIKSPHVARVYDVAARASGEPYMVMELLEGRDLGQLLASRGAVPPSDAVDYVLEACEALAEAHAKGIVHRDLKPSNLFVAHQEDGTSILKVLDFGISKLVQDSSSEQMSITRSQSMLGSPLYMAPEQLTAARDVDARCDIWSLGVILFELVAGRPPFDAGTVAELGALVLAGVAPSLHGEAPVTPIGLSEVVAKCMNKERTARWASILELAQALAPFASDRRRDAVLELVRRWSQPVGTGVPEAVRSNPEIWSAETIEAPVPPGGRTGGVWSTSSSAAPTHRRRTTLALALVFIVGVLAGVATLRSRSIHSSPNEKDRPVDASVSRAVPAIAETGPVVEPPATTTPTPSTEPTVTSSAPVEAMHTAPPRVRHSQSAKSQAPAVLPSASAPSRSSTPPRSDRFD